MATLPPVTSSDAGGGRVGDGRGRVRLGFVGAGGIVARALAAAAHAADGVVLQAVAARDVTRAERFEPAGRAYGDYAALIEDPDVDLVYVTLDNAGHLPWVLAALAAGKHVLCEKPIAVNPADLTTMTTAAAEHDRLLVEAFWYRWHPRTRRLEQLLRQGALGPLTDVDCSFSYSEFAGCETGPDPALEQAALSNFRLDPARGGGAVYDVGCYAVSAAHLAVDATSRSGRPGRTGRNPTPGLEVVGAQARRAWTGVDLEVSALLRPPADARPAGAARVRVHCGIGAVDRELVRVGGEAARVELTDLAFTARAVPVGLTITTPDRAVRVEQFAPVDPYRLMLESVAARIRGEDAFVVDLDHSRQVAATTAAILTAIRGQDAL